MTIPNGSSRRSVEQQLAAARQTTTPTQVQFTPGVFDGESEPEAEAVAPPVQTPEQQAMSAILAGYQPSPQG